MEEGVVAPHGAVMLLSDREGNNLGDAIQSKAVKNLLEPHGVKFGYCAKYEIHEYSGPRMYVVMNGEFSRWRMKCTWPEMLRSTPALRRLWFGFSIDPSDYESFVSEGGVECLKSEGLIGVRDSDTASFLAGKGVDVVVTGCASMTGYRLDATRSAKCLVGVDASDKDIASGAGALGLLGGEMGTVTMTFSGTLLGDTWEDIENAAEATVKGIYANAAAVVSPRVHAVMPILGSDTPIAIPDIPEDEHERGIEFCYAASGHNSYLARKAMCSMSRSMFRLMVESAVCENETERT